MRPFRRRVIWFTIAAVVVGLVAAAAAAFDSSKLAWRAALIRMKTAGQLPEFSWLDAIVAQYPDRLLAYQRRLASQVALVVGEGPVRIRARDFTSPCSACFETPLGIVWGRFEDAPTIATIADDIGRRGVYQFASVRIKPGDVVVDAGGHLGLFTRLALERGAGAVVAFEPEPVNAACYRKTFAEEIRRGKVKLVQAALWSAPGVLHFAPRSDNTAAGRVTGQGEVKVRATTLDLAVQELGLARVDFIKMDIEGSERYALEGARQTLRKFAPKLALCVYHLPDDRHVIPRLLREANPRYEIVFGVDQIYAMVPAPVTRSAYE